MGAKLRAFSRPILLILGTAFLLSTACQPRSEPFAPTWTASSPLTATTRPTASPTATITATKTPTPSPEPAWYQNLDPSYGALKYHYAEVIHAQARVYVSFQDAVEQTGNFGYLPNYPAYVAYTTNKTADNGQKYFLTNYGWMNGLDLQQLTPSSFSGFLLLRDVPFRFGWVLTETLSVNAAGEPIQRYSRYQIVHEAAAATEKPGYFAVGADEWLPEDAVALVNPAVPSIAGKVCRFIYVNLAEQTLSVYHACKPVFATLISSGQDSWTFSGRFAILYKVEYSSITPPPESTSEYYIEGVPYFMTYSGNFGFHGVYWHDKFGEPVSHGCINLSPADAKWLYDWAYIGDYVFIE